MISTEPILDKNSQPVDHDSDHCRPDSACSRLKLSWNGMVDKVRPSNANSWLNKNSVNLGKTILLTMGIFCFGLQAEILGPSLMTLMHQTKTTFTHVSAALSGKAAGMLIGSIIGGLVGDLLFDHRYLIVSFMLFVSSILYELFPFTFEISGMVVLLILVGLTHANININSNVLLGQMWDGHSGPAYNLMHMGFGLGGMIATLVIHPFVIKDPKSENGVEVIGPIIRGFPPFTIVAAISLLTSGLFFLTYMLALFGNRHCRTGAGRIGDELEIDKLDEEKKLKSSNFKTKFEESIGRLRPLENPNTYQLAIMILWPFAGFLITGGERMVGNFLVSYLSSLTGAQLTADNILMLNVIFWMMLTLGRLIFCLCTMFISVKIAFMAASVLTLFIMMGLSIWNTHVVAVYCAVSLYGFFASGLAPCLIGSVNDILEITGFMAMLFEIGSSAGSLCLTNLTGTIMAWHGGTSFAQVVCVMHLLILIVGGVMILLVEIERRKRNRVSCSNASPISSEKNIDPLSQYGAIGFSASSTSS